MPTSDWIVQQLREALPLPSAYRYVLFDRDTNFGANVVAFLKASAMKPMRTSVRSPWQNGVAERWVGSVRREVLDHVIPLNDQHFGDWGVTISPIITKTARILALRSKHPLAAFPPQLVVRSCLMHALEGCTIATIGPPN